MEMVRLIFIRIVTTGLYAPYHTSLEGDDQGIGKTHQRSGIISFGEVYIGVSSVILANVWTARL